MKRILAVGVLAAVMAGTAQGQLTASGSNFSGPGGGGGGTSATIGAYVPSGGYATVAAFNNVLFSLGQGTQVFAVGNVNVSVSAAEQKAVSDVFFGRISAASFANSLPGVPSVQAEALGRALNGILGAYDRQMPTVCAAAIEAFNAAINAMPIGTPVPPAIIAARALISGVYIL